MPQGSYVLNKLCIQVGKPNNKRNDNKTKRQSQKKCLVPQHS